MLLLAFAAVGGIRSSQSADDTVSRAVGDELRFKSQPPAGLNILRQHCRDPLAVNLHATRTCAEMKRQISLRHDNHELPLVLIVGRRARIVNTALWFLFEPCNDFLTALQFT
jgi:hypothetical protein